MRIWVLVAACFGLLVTSCATTNDAPMPVATGPYQYLRYLPKDYQINGNIQFPVLIFLHGSGEIGNDIEVVKKHGPPMLIAQGQDFPFIVISPQLDAQGSWNIPRLDQTLYTATNGLRIDTSRIYLTGLSLGGYGTWEWAAAHPRLFAALAPVAGRGRVSTACAIKHIPIWAFHGERDDAVPVRGSRNMIRALRACSSQPKFTLYPNEGHWSWVPAYNDPALYEWLLAQSNADGSAEFEKLKSN